MDTSKEYVLMCEKAKKYLFDKNRDIWIGRYVAVDGRVGLITACEFSFKNGKKVDTDVKTENVIAKFTLNYYSSEGNEKRESGVSFPFDDVFPVYRQDQLQDMIIDKYEDFYDIIDTFGYFIVNSKLKSMEQLWLAFVMFEKYSKEWSKNTWKSGGYILQHLLVMAKRLNRLLLSHEIVHHITGDKQDNKIENLKLTNLKEHGTTYQDGYRDGYADAKAKYGTEKIG